MVMVSNLSGGGFHYLAGRFPRMIGHLYSPNGWRKPPRWMDYALDNGAYIKFEPEAFLKLVERARYCGKKPLWIAVPDAVADREKTLALWDEWVPKLPTWPLAFVVQDGMTPDEPRLLPTLIRIWRGANGGANARADRQSAGTIKARGEPR